MLRSQKPSQRPWSRFITDYLRGRPELKRCLVLVDSRHGFKPTDVQVMDLLDEAAVNYQIVLTKADKQSGKGLATVTDKITQAIRRRVAAHPDIAVTSADKGTGIAELRATLARLAQPI